MASLSVSAVTVALVMPPLPVPITPQDAAAIALGFTDRFDIEGGCMGGEFLVRPDTDLDSRFKAWAVDWQEWSWVNGSSVLMERVH